MEEDRPRAGEPREARLYDVAEQQVEAAVAVEAGGRRPARSRRPRPLPQGLHGRAVDVHPGQRPKRPRIGDPPGRGAREDGDDEVADLLHEPVVVAVRAVPFEEGELGVVARPRLTGAKRAGDLEDGPAPGREKPLHRVFGGGLEPAGPSVGSGRAEARDARVRGPARAEERGLHLQHPPTGEEVPNPRDHPGAPFPSGAVAAGAPVRRPALHRPARPARRRPTP